MMFLCHFISTMSFMPTSTRTSGRVRLSFTAYLMLTTPLLSYPLRWCHSHPLAFSLANTLEDLRPCIRWLESLQNTWPGPWHVVTALGCMTRIVPGCPPPFCPYRSRAQSYWPFEVFPYCLPQGKSYFIGQADCNNFSCNHSLFSESSKDRLMLAQVPGLTAPTPYFKREKRRT